jgi:integrase
LELDLDADNLREYVMNVTEPNTRARKKFCTVIVAIAKFGGLDLSLSDLRGKYSGPKRQRKLPSDQQILEIGLNISNPGWRWVYGMMAVFGLRNHEVFFIDQEYLSSSGVCHVLEGKTFDGKVWPYYPEWLDLFDLKNIQLPNIRPGRLHIQYGQKVSKFFQREKIPFNPYSLRHCWARRTIDLGLDSRLAAKQMRHSHTVHTSTYNQWLGDEIHQQEWERIKAENPWDKQGS